MKIFLVQFLKSLFLTLVLGSNIVICKEKAPEPEPEIKMTKEQTKHAIEQTIKLTRKQLDADSGDLKKTEGLVINFVSRLEDLEVDEDSWPEISALINDLDSVFKTVSQSGESSSDASQAIEKLREFLKYGNDNFGPHKKADEKTEERKEAEPEKAVEKQKEAEKDYEAEMATGRQSETESFNKKEEKEEADNFDVAAFLERETKNLAKVEDKETLDGFVTKLVSTLSKQILTDKEGGQIGVLFDDKLSPLLMKHGLEGKNASDLSDLYARLKVVWPFDQKIEIETAHEVEKQKTASRAEDASNSENIEKSEVEKPEKKSEE